MSALHLSPELNDNRAWYSHTGKGYGMPRTSLHEFWCIELSSNTFALLVCKIMLLLLLC